MISIVSFLNKPVFIAITNDIDISRTNNKIRIIPVSMKILINRAGNTGRLYKKQYPLGYFDSSTEHFSVNGLFINGMYMIFTIRKESEVAIAAPFIPQIGISSKSPIMFSTAIRTLITTALFIISKVTIIPE